MGRQLLLEQPMEAVTEQNGHSALAQQGDRESFPRIADSQRSCCDSQAETHQGEPPAEHQGEQGSAEVMEAETRTDAGLDGPNHHQADAGA